MYKFKKMYQYKLPNTKVAFQSKSEIISHFLIKLSCIIWSCLTFTKKAKDLKICI